VDIDLYALRSYARATYAASDEYLATLLDEQLQQTVDPSSSGMCIPTIQNFRYTPCAGYMGHPFKKSPFDNDDYAFQTPFLRTDVLSSQHRVSVIFCATKCC